MLHLSDPHLPFIHFNYWVLAWHDSKRTISEHPYPLAIRECFLCCRNIIFPLWQPQAISLWSPEQRTLVKNGFVFPGIIFMVTVIFMYIVLRIVFENGYCYCFVSNSACCLPFRWPRFLGNPTYADIPGLIGTFEIIVTRKSPLATRRIFIKIETDFHSLLASAFSLK